MKQDRRQNWASFSVVIASFVVQIITLSFGAELYWLTDRKTFLSGVVLGSLLLSVLLCVSGNIGVKMRIPTAMQYGNIFGRLGARIMNLLLLPVGVLWVAWMSRLAALGVCDAFPSVPAWAVVTGVTAVSVLTAIRGVRGMEQSGLLQAPVVLALVLVSVVQILRAGGQAGPAPIREPAGSLTMADSVVFVILTWISVLSIYSDFTRNVRTVKDMCLGTAISYGVLNAVMMLSGGAFATVCGEEFSLIRGFAAAGIPRIFALAVLLLCTWTFNDRSFYSFGLAAGVVLGERVKSWIPVAAGGIAAAVIAARGLIDSLYSVLNILGCVYGPLLGVYLCRYYALLGIRECGSDFSGMIRFDYLPFIPWGAGLAAGMLLEKNQTISSFLISFALYYVLYTWRKRAKEKKESRNERFKA